MHPNRLFKIFLLALVLLIFYSLYVYNSIFDLDSVYIYDPRTDELYHADFSPQINPYSNYSKWSYFIPFKRLDYTDVQGINYRGKFSKIIQGQIAIKRRFAKSMKEFTEDTKSALEAVDESTIGQTSSTVDRHFEPLRATYAITSEGLTENEARSLLPKSWAKLYEEVDEFKGAMASDLKEMCKAKMVMILVDLNSNELSTRVIDQGVIFFKDAAGRLSWLVGY
jgi:hypothetical protein